MPLEIEIIQVQNGYLIREVCLGSNRCPTPSKMWVAESVGALKNLVGQLSFQEDFEDMAKADAASAQKP